MNYRRARISGGTYFFTVVTHLRRKLFIDVSNIAVLREAFSFVKARHPFEINAMVVLPDHLHCIWTLPEGDLDFPTRWRLIKTEFCRKCKHVEKEATNLSRDKKNERGVWQRRFWEHLVCDDNDFVRHVDYIHYNPVKHGLVKSPKDWPHSSFHRYVREGTLDIAWGAGMVFTEGMAGE